MSGGNIQEKYNDIKSRLDKAKLSVRSIEAELLALQHMCDHNNKSYGQYSSGICNDCGKTFWSQYDR